MVELDKAKRILGYKKKYNEKIRFGSKRQAVLERDGFKCISCGMTESEHKRRWGKSLPVDHIDGHGRYHKVKNNSMNNLQTLCIPCHMRKDARLNGTCILQPADIPKIRKIRGKTHQEISDMFGVHRSTITCVLNNKTWGYIK